MSKPVCRLAFFLLLLALPLQALAAAAMAFCGPAAHQYLVAWGHDVGSPATLGHDGDRHQHEHDRFNAPHGDPDTGPLGHLAGSCSACSDCCCPATLAPAGATALAHAGDYFVPIPYVAQQPPGLAPKPLERPPRSTLV